MYQTQLKKIQREFQELITEAETLSMVNDKPTYKGHIPPSPRNKKEWEELIEERLKDFENGNVIPYDREKIQKLLFDYIDLVKADSTYE